MNYKIAKIKSKYTVSRQCAILIIYTVGIIGMVQDATGGLVPFNFIKEMEHMPELCRIEV